MKAKTNNNTHRQPSKLLNSSLPLQQLKQHEPEHQQEPELIIAPKTMRKFEALLLPQKIKKSDLDILTIPEKELFYKYLNKLFHQKKDVDWDILVEKMEDIISPDVNEDIREDNRIKINNAIATSLKQHGKMPSKAQIARITDLSRSTVQKHLKEFAPNDDFKQYLYAKTKIMESVIKAAVNGDMRAAKLYMGTVTKLSGAETNTTIINQQNNYIQLNGKIQYLQNLPEERLKQIEEIINLPLGMKED